MAITGGGNLLLVAAAAAFYLIHLQSCEGTNLVKANNELSDFDTEKERSVVGSVHLPADLNQGFLDEPLNLSLGIRQLKLLKSSKKSKKITISKSYSDKGKKFKKGKQISKSKSYSNAYLNHLREVRNKQKGVEDFQVLSQDDNLLTALERGQDRVRALNDEAQMIGLENEAGMVGVAASNCDKTCQDNRKGLIEILSGIAESVGALITLFNCATGPGCERKDWADAALTLTTGLIPLIILAGVPGLNIGLVFAGAAIAKEVIVVVLQLLWDVSDDNYDLQMTNSEMIVRLNERKIITEQSFKDRFRNTEIELTNQNQQDVTDVLAILNDILDSSDTNFIREEVEYFIASGLQRSSSQISLALGEMENVVRTFANWRSDYFLNKKPFLDDCETDGHCGKGAAHHLINGRFNDVRACVEDQQYVIRTLPIFFESLKHIKDFISAYPVALRLWNILDKILKLDEYKSNRLLLGEEKIARCYLERINRLSQSMEKLGQIEGLCSPFIPDFKLPDGLTVPTDLSVYNSKQLERTLWWRTCPDSVCNGIVPFAQVCECNKDKDCDRGTGSRKCNFPYLLYRCWDNKIPETDPNTGRSVVGAQLVRKGNIDEIENKRRNIMSYGWIGYKAHPLHRYSARPTQPLKRILFIGESGVKDCPGRWPWQDGDNFLYALPRYCLNLVPSNQNRQSPCLDEMKVGYNGADWIVNLDCPYLRERNM